MVAKEDRISNLPDDVIHRILSFLDVTHAIETRKLSKKWKHIWTSMPYLNLNSQTVGNLPKLSKFVKHETSLRKLVPAVSAVELSLKGSASQLVGVVISIVKYLYSHNIKQLTLIWSEYTRRILEFPWLFKSHTLKHLTLATTRARSFHHAQSIAVSTWDFPVLETLNLSNIPFADKGDRSLNLFSKCVNLKDLTLHHCAMSDMDTFNVCAPRLSNLTITDPDGFPKVFRVVAPQLENLTASVNSIHHLYGKKVFYFLQLSTSDLDRLEKVDLSLPRPLCEKERYAPRLLDLFHKLRTAKFLILDMGIIEALSSSLNQILHEPCPFNNLKCLRIKTVPLDHVPIMPTQVINYLLKSSPSATFIVDLPQVSHEISRQEVDKDNMAKKMARLDEEKQQQKTMVEETRSRHEALSSCPNQLSHQPSLFDNSKCLRQTDRIPRTPTQERNYLHQRSLMGLPQKITRQEVDKGAVPKKLVKLEEEKQLETMAEENRSRNKAHPSWLDKLSHEPSLFNQLLHEPSPFNNLKRLRQVDSIPRMPTQVKSYLHESTSSTTSLMDLSQSQKRSKHEVEKGTMAKKLAMLEEEKQQMETMVGEKRMIEEKIQMQEETIAQQKAMMEAMKLQYEKRMLKAKMEIQNKVIAQQKSMMEAMKLQHEKGTMEAKIQMQDLVIAEQKSMLEARKLQHETKMLAAKMQSQYDIIAQQKDMLEATRLRR